MRGQKQLRGGHGRGRGNPGGRGGHSNSQPSSTTLYKCALGGEMKALDQFSNHQRQRAGVGRRQVDPLACGMICLEHTNASNKETIQCHGACRRELPLDHFSKNTRRNREFVCMQCRSWIDNEPTPSGATSDWSDDEDAEYRIVYPEPELEVPSTESDEHPMAPVTGTLDILASTISADHDVHSESTQQGYMPTHLRRAQETTTASLHASTNSIAAALDTRENTTGSLRNGSDLVPLSFMEGEMVTPAHLQIPDELSSIAPNPWYEHTRDSLASGNMSGVNEKKDAPDPDRQVDRHTSPATVESWADKARRFLAEGSQADGSLGNQQEAVKNITSNSMAKRVLQEKSTNRDRRTKRATTTVWDDDGHSHRAKSSGRKGHLEAPKFTGKDDAGARDPSTNDLFRPRKANYENEQAWLDAQPDTVFDDPYASDHNN